MRVQLLLALLTVPAIALSQNEIQMKSTQFDNLTEEEKRVIVNKGTEPAFSGEYNKHFEAGTYACKACESPLFRSSNKFKSNCGWPSFDDEIKGAIERRSDNSGGMVRTEIVCAACGGHLGHVFEGEQLTPKDTRHCVNSISVIFVPEKTDD
jgi:methionine-R-sulfoxide reductase